VTEIYHEKEKAEKNGGSDPRRMTTRVRGENGPVLGGGEIRCAGLWKDEKKFQLVPKHSLSFTNARGWGRPEEKTMKREQLGHEKDDEGEMVYQGAVGGRSFIDRFGAKKGESEKKLLLRGEREVKKTTTEERKSII